MAALPGYIVRRIGQIQRQTPDHWPMSFSYPAPSGYIETMALLRMLEVQDDVTVHLNEDPQFLGEEDKNTTRKEIKEKVYSNSAFYKETVHVNPELDYAAPTDDVDGITEDILVPISKMVFLKIIFLDIGISVGDIATDCIQGYSLVFDTGWSLKSTWMFGLTICLVMWLPAPIALIVYSNQHKAERKSQNTVLNWILFFIFFPVVPIIMFLRILLTPRRFASPEEAREFDRLEQLARKLKSVTGAIESPIQAVILFWLMIRGVLTLPWSEPPSASCVEDSLGRVACLPSIPVFSLIFSFLSITKTVFDMNIHPLMTGLHNSIEKSKFSLHFFLCSFPFFLCSIVFRLTAYAFILTYIDYWSIIPATILYFISLLVLGINLAPDASEKSPRYKEYILEDAPLEHMPSTCNGTKKVTYSEQEEEIEQDKGVKNAIHESMPIDIKNNGAATKVVEDEVDGQERCKPVDEVDGFEMYKPVDEVDAPTTLIWNGHEWISRSIIESRQSYGKSVSMEEPDVGFCVPRPLVGDIQVVDIPVEEGTSMLLNSILGFFYPVCYLSLNPNLPKYSNLPVELLNKQLKIIKSLVMVYNVTVLIVVIVIFILVTFCKFFNYYTNILDSFWFSMATIFIVLMGLMSLIWCCNPFPTLNRTFKKILAKEDSTQQSQVMDTSLISSKGLRKRIRHPTVESNRGSIYSATTNIIKERLGPEHTVVNTLYCLASTVGIVLPTILGLLLFMLLPVHQTKVFIFKESGGFVDVVSVQTVYSSNSLHLALLKGIVGNCTNQEDIVYIETKTTCDLKGASGLVVVDTSPVEEWRVSSPLQIYSSSENSYVAVRQLDWEQLLPFKPNQTIHIVFQKLKSSLLEKLVDCSQTQTVYTEESSDTSCQMKKHLGSDGIIYERRCISQKCFQNGMFCEDYVQEFRLHVPCINMKLDGTKLVGGEGELLQVNLPVGGSVGRFCCLNTTNILEAFGPQCPSTSANLLKQVKDCDLSHFYPESGCQPFQKFSALYRLNKNCIIKESYSTPCGFHQEILNICRDSNLFCDQTTMPAFSQQIKKI